MARHSLSASDYSVLFTLSMTMLSDMSGPSSSIDLLRPRNRGGQPRTGSSPVSGTIGKPNAEECPPRLVISTATLTAKVLNRGFHPPFDLRFLRGTVCPFLRSHHASCQELDACTASSC